MMTMSAKPKTHASVVTPLKSQKPSKFSSLTLIGWREWVALPQLGVERMKAKIDTGARTSALHAWDIEPFEKDGAPWVRFSLHPIQRNNRTVVTCAAAVMDRRLVRNTGGKQEMRYVIETGVTLGTVSWPIELTLTNRDKMGFRLLLGRTALKNRFLINPGRSYIATRT